MPYLALLSSNRLIPCRPGLNPWSRGGYAVFDAGFPTSQREWLAQPCGQVFFAGEHTSLRWQGYMNGAVESGHRAAHEVRAAHMMSR